MGRFTRQELEEAHRIYNEAHRKASESGDWTIWAAIFTEDAEYVEHAFGEFHGRQEIEKWIVEVMAPFPHMTFPQEWHCFDEENDAIVCCVQNTMPALPGSSQTFSYPNWTRVVYAGGGKFSYEEDIYNYARDAKRVIVAWLKAGGRFEAQPKLKPKYS